METNNSTEKEVIIPQDHSAYGYAIATIVPILAFVISVYFAW